MNIRLLVFLFLTMLCPIATIEAQDLSHAEKSCARVMVSYIAGIMNVQNTYCPLR